MISVADAAALAADAHGADRTRSGGLFIDHVRRVAARMVADPDPYAVPAAWLHDTVEKGSAGWSDLRSAGADEGLLSVVDALTERDGEPVESYLGRCAADPLALRIKRADIADKLSAAALREVPAAHVEELRARAHRRLDLLDRLAAELA